MNARQKAKNLKKKINTLESDNKLMQDIIADSPAMQELYDLYNKPKFVTHTTMQFQEFRVKRMVPVYMRDLDGFIERAKQAVVKDLLEEIKENITYEVDTECMAPTIIASIFIGKKE
ncbi:MAG: hypothetical protein J6T10_29440 [Methanobrevibacter sp.]|nr:hypothetical protein [Methanobrevibacter sp.]